MARRVEMKRAVVASVSSARLSTRAGEKGGRETCYLTTWHPDIHPLGWASPALQGLLSKVYNWRDPHMLFDRLSGPFRSRFFARLRRGGVIWGCGGE